MGKRRSPQRRKKASRKQRSAPPAKGSFRQTTTRAKPHAAAIAQLLQQATLHHNAGRHAEARPLYAQVLALDAKHPHAHYGLGQCLSRLGNHPEGIRLTRRAVELQPERAQYHVSLADLYSTTLQIDKSIAAAKKALTLDPRNVGASCVLATNLERRREFQAGIDQLKQAEQFAPQDVYLQTLLARLERRNRAYSAARRRIDNLLARPNLETEYRRRILFEQAAVLDEIGEYDNAFTAIVAAGEIMHASPAARRLNPQARPARIASYQAGINAEVLQRWAPEVFTDRRPAPAFLVGFPRSGTTMTEQVLAAHPRICTADERPYINNLRRAWVRQVGGSNDVRAMFERLTLAGARDLRALYWQQVEQEFGTMPDTKIFIDKFPLNIIDIGFINVIFPDAKVIVALRDPRDVCLSCLLQDFILNNAMLHFLRLEDTVRFYAQVMNFYLAIRNILTFQTIEIRYEDTVADLETQATRILKLLDAAWDPALLQFHEKARGKIISTPSFEAVTQPIHRGAIGRWKNYRKFFEPLQTKLKPFVEEFGYAPE